MHVKSTIAPSQPNRGVALAPANYTATSTSTEMVAANKRRIAMVLQNLGNKNVSIAFGSHAAVFGSGITLDKQGGTLAFDSTICITGTIQVVSESGTSSISIQEFE